ncbi:MAG: hypothetical protein PUJ75_03585 [Bacteroidales bacterium]|nr:hypothetical protein [Bacteroidales bacterium]MDY5788739.1 hypothetical protein [Candidatus Onthomorpha sp.]
MEKIGVFFRAYQKFDFFERKTGEKTSAKSAKKSEEKQHVFAIQFLQTKTGIPMSS